MRWRRGMSTRVQRPKPRNAAAALPDITHLRELFGVDVDGDDASGACGLAAHDHGKANATQPKDGNSGALLDLVEVSAMFRSGSEEVSTAAVVLSEATVPELCYSYIHGVHNGAVACGDAAAQQAHLGQQHIASNAYATSVRAPGRANM